MKHMAIVDWTLCIVLATAVAGRAEDACCPASGVPTSAASDAEHAGLPEGHPPVPQGHPQVGQALPEGHPPLESGDGAAGEPARGTLVVKVNQGTPGGDAVSGAVLSLELLHQGNVVKHLEARLDANGTAMFEDLEVGDPVQPVASVRHGGAEFRKVGGPMGPSQPDQVLRLTVYASTDEAPPWEVSARHVMVTRAHQGLMVREMLIVQNPSDKAWRGALVAPAVQVGEAPAGAEPAERTTLALALPPGATHLQLGESFGGGRVRVDGDRLISSLPIVPGTTRYLLAYLLPVRDGAVRLELTAPAPVRRTIVMLPPDMNDVTAEGLTLGQSTGDQAHPMKLFEAPPMASDAKATLLIRSVGPASAAAADAYGAEPEPAPQDGGAAGGAKAIAGAGAGLLLLGTAVLVFRKPRSQPAR